jgi:hypothetical protein
VRVVQKAVAEAVVVVTEPRAMRRTWLLRCAATLLLPVAAQAAVLPEERADVLYHRYEGGGMLIDGPSVLVRKNFQDKVSVVANYYVDNVTSASIDVLSNASPYEEEREEMSLGVEYLHDKTSLGASFTQSEESDYAAKTVGFSWSQDFFGDLTALSFGLALGQDDVGRNGDPAFSESVDRHSFRLGYAQVLSARAVLGLAHEVVADQGYLNNSYRSVRFLDDSVAGGPGYAYQQEIYPRTRTSNATALRVAYHLASQDALRGEVRFFADTWGISAQNIALAYTRDVTPNWRVEWRMRSYSQDRADFYSDLFPYRDAQNYLARDKEMSTFDSMLYGMGISYLIKAPETSPWQQMSFNLQFEHLEFDYADFRNVLANAAAGTEPLYGYTAMVTRLYFSLWY